MSSYTQLILDGPKVGRLQVPRWAGKRQVVLRVYECDYRDPAGKSLLDPSRTQALMGPTLVLTLAWSAVMIVLLVQYPACDPRLVQASLAYVVYYLGASLWLNLDPPAAGPATM